MTVHWGIVGAGKIAESQFAPAVASADGHELAAVSRRELAAAQRFAERHGARRAYNSVEALLEDDEVSAVYVATPPHLHARETVLAAEAGKHVLCEKPMAMTTGEAREMIDACRASGVLLTICHYQRFNARHQRIRRLLEEGAVGQVTAARINFSDRFPPQPGVWHHDPEISGGGPVMDLGIHCIDLLRFLCGPAESVAALVETLVDRSPVADTSTLLLRLASGAQAVVTSHWTTANHEPERANGLEICGTEGSIVAAPISAKDSSGSLQVLTAEGTRDYSIGAGGPRPHVALVEAFGRAVEGEGPNPIPGEEGLAGLAVVEAANESARSENRVALQDSPD
ncbi:MAG: Gfo/Idh/MocA family oxidoreductase [Caldilineaceae bacterium]|nr:Gfo/Idh/MocA family oxidoreductase [Caldilineaceae bacterium]